MSNEIVKTVNPYDMAVNDVETTQRLCSKLMQTKHFAKMGEEGIYAIVTKAKSLGIDPIEALGGSLFYLQGKVGMSTEMMAALIRQKGHSITKDAKSNDGKVILHGKRVDTGDTWTCDFSLDDAKKAGLLKNMYEKYPKVMLYNRCMSMLARQLFPDVIKGVGYDMSELKEIAQSKEPSEQSEDVKEIISKEQADEIISLLSVCSVDYQDKVMKSLKNMPDPIPSIYALPLELYDRVKNAAILNCVKPEEKSVINIVEEEEIVNATGI